VKRRMRKKLRKMETMKVVFNALKMIVTSILPGRR
jgi:hypothetical protein